MIVGHQPWIGERIHWLLMDATAPLSVRKVAVWWLQSRKCDGINDVIILAVATPELLWRANILTLAGNGSGFLLPCRFV